MFERVVQYVDEAKTEADAERTLAFLRQQVDYRGGRILPPAPDQRAWKIQAFFEDVDVDEHLLPDGSKRVFVRPDWLAWLAGSAMKPLAMALLAGLIMAVVGCSEARARGHGSGGFGGGHSSHSHGGWTHVGSRR